MILHIDIIISFSPPGNIFLCWQLKQSIIHDRSFLNILYTLNNLQSNTKCTNINHHSLHNSSDSNISLRPMQNLYYHCDSFVPHSFQFPYLSHVLWQPNYSHYSYFVRTIIMRTMTNTNSVSLNLGKFSSNLIIICLRKLTWDH